VSEVLVQAYRTNLSHAETVITKQIYEDLDS